MVYHRGGVGGLLDRLRDADRRKVALALLVPLCLVAAVVFFVGRGGEDGSSDAAPAGSGASADAGAGPEAGDGLMVFDGGLPEEEAFPVPTETPEPTPDIAATVQARLFEGARAEHDPRLPGSMLQAEETVGPRLSRQDRKYLEQLGEDLWYSVRAYLRLREVSAQNFPELSWSFLEERVKPVERIYAAERERERERIQPGDEVSRVVRDYGAGVKAGMEDVRQGYLELIEMYDIFRETGVTVVVEMTNDDRDRVYDLFYSMDTRLLKFDRLMSSHGCSVCGELFRAGTGALP